MKIVVDAFGGDNAPREIVSGAVNALSEREGFKVVLTGKSDEINALLKEYSFDSVSARTAYGQGRQGDNGGLRRQFGVQTRNAV